MKLNEEEINRLAFICDDPVMLITEVAAQHKTKLDTYPTGFPSIDKAIGGGFQEGNLVIVSGISGEGKTSLMETFTANYINQGVPCLWFTYEIPVPVLHWRFKRMGLEDNYEAYCPKIHTTGKIYWLDQKIKESWLKNATKAVFVDMISFLSPSEVNNKDNEVLILSKIARELKTLAVDLNCIIFVTAHITKLKEGDEPGMQNIAWSSGIYQFADFVFMIHRERDRRPRRSINEPVSDICTPFSIIKIVKNRATGELKRIKCGYAGYKFSEVDYGHQEDNPRAERAPYFGQQD